MAKKKSWVRLQSSSAGIPPNAFCHLAHAKLNYGLTLGHLVLSQFLFFAVFWSAEIDYMIKFKKIDP